MKVFVAGATGAIGRPLVRMLVAGGHEVVGTTRAPAKVDALQALGVQPVVLDALDRDAVLRTVTEARPEIVIHQLTGLTVSLDYKRFDDSFAATNRLRTEGTDNLLEAALATGARRFIAQSFGGGLFNERTGAWVKTEEDPLDHEPMTAARESLAAIRHLEAAVTAAEGIEGVVLRYGLFYGPGTNVTHGGQMLETVRGRRMPVIGGGAGRFSFVQVEDAAAATVRAVDRGAPGIYFIVDDEPAPAAEWIPELARVIGAKPPLRVPASVGRHAAGEVAVTQFTQMRGSSNAKARRELGWTPRYPTWREGFRQGLRQRPDADAGQPGRLA